MHAIPVSKRLSTGVYCQGRIIVSFDVLDKQCSHIRLLKIWYLQHIPIFIAATCVKLL